MIEFHKGPSTTPRQYTVGSDNWYCRPPGFYFKPYGYYMDGNERICGPYPTEEAAKVAQEKFEVDGCLK